MLHAPPCMSSHNGVVKSKTQHANASPRRRTQTRAIHPTPLKYLAMAPVAAAAAAAAQPEDNGPDPSPASHAPSVAGSVIEASDGLGGTNYIRIQNIASTGKNMSVSSSEKSIEANRKQRFSSGTRSDTRLTYSPFSLFHAQPTLASVWT